MYPSKKFSLSLALIATVALVSCGKAPEEAAKTEAKTEFKYSSVPSSEFGTTASVEKIGRVTGASTRQRAAHQRRTHSS